jgi:hypothetical protein
MDGGRVVLSLGADQAREQFQKIRARFSQATPDVDLAGALHVKRSGRELDFIVNRQGGEVLERLKEHAPESVSAESLTLEEIFVATLKS